MIFKFCPGNVPTGRAVLLLRVKTSVTVLLLLLSSSCWCQQFPAIGQLPASAFPVCGTDTFSQSVVPLGSSGVLQVPGCTTYSDTNPFWYTFTCYKAGTLGFLIKPNNQADDYDWMLFDVTNRDISAIYTDISLVVSGNWSGSSGNTGAIAGASPKIQCGSDPADNITTFTAMPVLKLGHKYLLLISHFNDTQTGYSLIFKGGTALINDPALPAVVTVTPLCDRQTLGIHINQRMRCKSLAADGTDFSIAGTSVTVSSARGINCNNAFDMDSVQLSLSAPLVPGDYILTVMNGSDENTLLNDCGSQIPEGDHLSFTVLPPKPTPFDNLTTVSCAPYTLQLVFSDPMLCSSIAADGSDFKIIGSPAVSISRASGNCAGEVSNIITVTLSAPIVLNGFYQIVLETGSDGNTIINQCGLETPAGGSLPFSILDTVSAAFNYTVDWGCRYDTISISYVAANGINQWNWTIDSSNFESSLFQPLIIESDFGQKTLQHIVSNGFCTDTATQIINLNNKLVAAFSTAGQVCPKDVIPIINTSAGRIIQWSWDFGDGTVSADKSPQDHLYPDTWAGKTYTMSLAVRDDIGCTDTVSAQIIKLQSCYITVPNAFTPNGDGKNDYLYPLNGFMGTNMEFIVYNRYGQRVFESRDWSRKWDGKINGVTQPFGTYVWTLSYTDPPSGKNFFLKGTSVLIR